MIDQQQGAEHPAGGGIGQGVGAALAGEAFLRWPISINRPVAFMPSRDTAPASIGGYTGESF
jgi:hypothetical protein